MPSSLYLSDLILDQFVDSYITLLTELPAEGNDWQGIAVSGGDYGDQPAFFTRTFDDPTSGSNNLAVAFTGMPDTTVLGMGYINGTGDLLHWGAFGSPKVFSAGETATVAAHALLVTVPM